MSFFQDSAFFQRVLEKAIDEEKDSEHKNAMLITLSHFSCLTNITGMDPESTSAIRKQLDALRTSVTDDINLVLPLSADLLSGHTAEEEDLFFEVAIGDEAVQALKMVARRRLLARWSQAEICVCRRLAD